VATHLEKAGAGSFDSRVAHYWCELTLEADEHGQPDEAEAALQHARAVAPNAARPLVIEGERHAAAGRHAEAVQAWNELRNRNPGAFSLVAGAYARSALATGRGDSAHAALSALLQRTPGIDLLRAIALVDSGPEATERRLTEHLARQPSLAVAADVLRTPVQRWTEPTVQALRNAVDRAAKPLQRYRCAACGFEAQHYFWQCPGCLGWDSYPPQRIEEL
jgi:lipopolysaccharide biosynthesis regulator YciM